MYRKSDKPKDNKSRAVAYSVIQQKSNLKQRFGFVSNRQETIQLLKLQENTNIQIEQKQYSIQKRDNKTGLPEQCTPQYVKPIQCLIDKKGMDQKKIFEKMYFYKFLNEMEKSLFDAFLRRDENWTIDHFMGYIQKPKSNKAIPWDYIAEDESRTATKTKDNSGITTKDKDVIGTTIKIEDKGEKYRVFNKSKRLPKDIDIETAVNSYDPDPKLIGKPNGANLVTQKITAGLKKSYDLDPWQVEKVYEKVQPLVTKRFFTKKKTVKALEVLWKCSERDKKKAKNYKGLETRLNTIANYNSETGKPCFNNAHFDDTRIAQWKLQADVAEKGSGSDDRLHINVKTTDDKIIVEVVALSLDTK